MPDTRDHTVLATPIGPVLIEADREQLLAIRLTTTEPPRAPSSPLLRTAANQLHAYFTGDRVSFDLPLAPMGSSRGRELRAGMVDIGFGETMSYGALARTLSSGARAIGQLCARNPFPIVVPCHRVVGSGGALGHYSAGEGVSTKQWLLDHEQRVLRTR